MHKTHRREVAQTLDLVPRAAPALPDSDQLARRQSDRQNSRQRTMREKSLKIIGLFAGLYVGILAVLQGQGQIDGATFGVSAAAVLVAMLGLSATLLERVRQRIREKHLAVLLAICSFVIMLVTMYAAPATRVAFGPFVFLVIAFGVFHFTRRGTLVLCAAAVAGYATVLVLSYGKSMSLDAVRAAAIDLIVLAATLPAFSHLACRVSRLHNALDRAGRRIRDIGEDARHDRLLGCYNRRYAIAVLGRHKRVADKYGLPLCLAVFGLDHFKRINDEVGHLIGDEVLRAFVEVARSHVRQEDVFARYFGEEFLLILPQTQLLAALNTVERIRDEVERQDWRGTLHSGVTVSIGLTQYLPGESLLDLFSRSDSAMYLAKRGGRNQVVVEEPTCASGQEAGA